MLWVQTSTKCLHSEVLSSLSPEHLQAFSKSLLLPVCLAKSAVGTAISHQKWSETARSSSTYTITRSGLCVFRLFNPNPFSARHNEEAALHLAFSWLCTWDFPSLNQGHWSYLSAYQASVRNAIEEFMSRIGFCSTLFKTIKDLK